jgi:hypothetical protein
LLLKVSHSLAVNFDYLKINVTFQGYSKEVEIQGSSGDTLVNLVEMLPYELSADDAGVYNYQVDYFLKLSDNTEAEEIESTVSSVNLIPTGFYVLVTCNTGSIYTKDTEEHNLFQTGIVNLQLTAYNGLVNSGNNYSVNVTITDPEGGITEKIVTLKERTNTTYSLNCNIEGTYIIKLSRSGFEKYTYLYTSDKYKNIDYFLKSIDVYE